MPKTFSDLARHALNGATMGTRWSALFHAPADFDSAPLRAAMAAVVDAVDRQMSTWKPESDLNRLNAAAPGEWVELPAMLTDVLAAGLAVGRASNGAFDIGMGDAVGAWGFGAAEADPEKIGAARGRNRRPAHDVLELDPEQRRARKHEPMQLTSTASPRDTASTVWRRPPAPSALRARSWRSMVNCARWAVSLTARRGRSPSRRPIQTGVQSIQSSN